MSKQNVDRREYVRQKIVACAANLREEERGGGLGMLDGKYAISARRKANSVYVIRGKVNEK